MALSKKLLQSFLTNQVRRRNVISSIATSFSTIEKQKESTNDVEKTTATTTTGSDGLFTQVWEKFSVEGQQRRIQIGERLFRAAQWQAMNPAWYGKDKIPTSFRPQHAMISMHVWFLHKRLLVDSKSNNNNRNLSVDEELFEFLWNDTKSRIRAVNGIHELMVNKHLKDAQQSTFLQCTQYDHAFTEFADDPKGRFEIVCDSVWKHVLNGKDDTSEELIRRIGAYVMFQAENIISKLPDHYFEEGMINWGSMLDLENAGQSGVEEDYAVTDTKGTGLEFLDQERTWVKVLADSGHPYYWNTKSNKTFWEPPNIK